MGRPSKDAAELQRIKTELVRIIGMAPAYEEAATANREYLELALKHNDHTTAAQFQGMLYRCMGCLAIIEEVKAVLSNPVEKEEAKE